jgi:hypothetical protein
MASSVDGIHPATKIKESHQTIINCKTVGNSDGKLTTQMRALDQEEVEWSVSLTSALRNGIFMYPREGYPRNLSLFMLHVKDPKKLNKQ